jgi:hypothetical protein
VNSTRIGFVAVIGGWAAFCAPASSAPKPLVITYDQQSGAQTMSGIAEASPGESVILRVINTNTTCFDYNGAPKPAVAAAAADTSQFEIPLSQQRKSSGYTMEVTKKSNPPATCGAVFSTLSERKWSTDVSVLGWELSFSGAFSIDGLSDRAYFLEDGTSNGTPGFVVTRSKDAESSTNQRLAFLIHLYNSRWEQHRSVTWAPITFGMSIDDNTRYLIGTSLKIGDKLFLTGGGVFGKIKVLPASLSEGEFTTDQNALGTLGTKSDRSWFIALSYSFLGTNAKDQFSSLFPKAAPKP